MGWFTPRYSAKTIHKEVNVKSIMFLQQLIKYNEKAIENFGIIKEMERLSSIGLSCSLNYKILESKIKSIRDYNLTVERFNELRDVLLEIKETFNGLDCRFLSFEDFEKILYKYDLRCGTLDMYIGDIPEKNLKELEFVTQQMNEMRKSDKLQRNQSKLANSLKYIKLIYKVSLFRSDVEKVNKTKLKENMMAFPFWYANESETTMLSRFSNGEFNSSLTDVYASNIGKYNVLIAAPRNQIDNKITFEVKERAKSEDPIIFSITDYGILCYTAWGEEANDVYKQYEHMIEEVNKISI